MHSGPRRGRQCKRAASRVRQSRHTTKAPAPRRRWPAAWSMPMPRQLAACPRGLRHAVWASTIAPGMLPRFRARRLGAVHQAPALRAQAANSHRVPVLPVNEALRRSAIADALLQQQGPIEPVPGRAARLGAAATSRRRSDGWAARPLSHWAGPWQVATAYRRLPGSSRPRRSPARPSVEPSTQATPCLPASWTMRRAPSDCMKVTTVAIDGLPWDADPVPRCPS